MEQPRRQTTGHATRKPTTGTLSAETLRTSARAMCDLVRQLLTALSEVLGREIDHRDLQDIAEGRCPAQDLYDDLLPLEDEDDSGEPAIDTCHSPQEGGYQRLVELSNDQLHVTLMQHPTRKASDLKQECRTCNTAFLLTANEKNAFEALSSHQPTHCTTCRLRRRDQRAAGLRQKLNWKRRAAPTDDLTETCMGKSQTLLAQTDRPEQTTEQPGAPPRVPTPMMQTAPKRTIPLLDCQDCDGQFPFPRPQQLMFVKKGWRNPIRCQDCRVINNQPATKGQAGAARPTPPPARPKTTRPATNSESANATTRRASMAAAAATLEASNEAAAAALIASNATAETQRQATQRLRTPAPAAHAPPLSDARDTEDPVTQETQAAAPATGLTVEQKKQRTLAKDARKLSVALAKQAGQDRTRAANVAFAAAQQNKTSKRAATQQSLAASRDQALTASAAVRKANTARTVLRNAERAAKRDGHASSMRRAMGRGGAQADQE